MKRFAWAILGLMLLAFSAYGIVYGIRVEWAQLRYFQAKYGSAKDNPDRIFSLCEKAYPVYPFNYNFCIWAAETAYYTSSEVSGNESIRRRALAERWCGTGLKSNFYKSQLRLLKTRLLAEEDLSDAIRYWEAYVDWQFWAPYNHAVLVDLYSRAGDFDKALQSLEWVKGSEYHEEARRHLQEAWSREKRFTKPSDMPP
jgi:tetratricopeptide (TPR) repeat protein